LAALASFLFFRGWTLQRIGLNARLLDTAIGLLLAVASALAANLAVLIAAGFRPDFLEAANNPAFVTPGFDAGTVLAASALNGLFEEVFLCGYVITVLKERRGFWTAINVSVAIRLSYHLYQGPIGVLQIVPVGLIFGYFYARTGRLWPLVVAHVLVDFLSLMAYTN
jgi:membrane protease YdiL (CAAX protease family)